MSVDIVGGNAAKAMVMTLGGDQFYSSDSGATWAYHGNNAFRTDGAECPYFKTTNNDFMALGRCIGHPSLNRVIASNGIGVFQIDTVPRTSISQLWADKSLGIQQKLVMDVRVTPSGRLLACAQDKPLYIYERTATGLQPTKNHPDALVPIRHSNGCDFARDDENYLVLPYQPAQDVSLPGTNTIQISLSLIHI